MAVNESGSMNGNLVEGITDGIVKKLAPNRGSLTDRASVQAVYDQLPTEYGVEFSDAAKTAAARRLTTVRG